MAATTTDRWSAATRIQCQWRGHHCRDVVRALLADRMGKRQAIFDESDRMEAGLLIQTRIRMFLAKRRTERIRQERTQRPPERPATHVHPHRVDPRLFVFSSNPPSDDEVLDLFDAMDPLNTGKIPRAYARAVFDRLLSDLHPGDPTVAFNRAIQTADDQVTASALYLVVLRALAL